MTKIIIITGPTATGKTALGALIAKNICGEVVSADSMQVYKHMDIGTAKPLKHETLGVAHHMIGIVPPWEDYSVSNYVRDASICVEDIAERGKIPVLVGGSGLYIDSLVTGRTFAEVDIERRRVLYDKFDAIGGEMMLRELAKFDTISAIKLHANDKRRIIRAFEVFESTGMTITELDAETQKLPPKYEAIKIALTFSDRSDLYARIDKRVDIMLEVGLEDEVRDLLKMGVLTGNTAMQAIGYKEIAEMITEGGNLEQAADKIKMESRRYAKRQLTWLRRDTSVKWITWEKTPNLDLGLSISTGFLQTGGYNVSTLLKKGWSKYG